MECDKGCWRNLFPRLWNHKTISYQLLTIGLVKLREALPIKQIKSRECKCQFGDKSCAIQAIGEIVCMGLTYLYQFTSMQTILKGSQKGKEEKKRQTLIWKCFFLNLDFSLSSPSLSLKYFQLKKACSCISCITVRAACMHLPVYLSTNVSADMVEINTSPKNLIGLLNYSSSTTEAQFAHKLQKGTINVSAIKKF